ncbi:hypothetical protein J5226_01115 [Lysobacter sp. K5869]|uniref:hypothetical protein n=1 Tax=Lysobacter sp. K5869 TaxID=2820808 RepID=UPI001C05FBFA|nr:hypothetical protein [Lysobacter sp. K5869]QWP77036.1 hypothetical protein J5226_01115 [Lysobacter sp. K5869]
MSFPRSVCVALACATAFSSAAVPQPSLARDALAQVSPARAAQARAVAPEGALDRDFGSGGWFLAQTPDPYFDPAGIVVQRDGKILALGTSGRYGSPEPSCRLIRLLPDGALDPAFGDNGSVRTGDPAGYTACRSLALRADGRIVVAGRSGKGFVVLRLRADGSADPAFGDGGATRTEFEDLGFPEAEPFDLAVQDDGRIVLAGRAVDPREWPMRTRFAVARYGEDGRLDPGFGDGGRVLTSFADYSRFDAEAQTLAIQADGRIVVAGGLGGAYATAMARYLPDGRLDPSFGEAGRLASYGEGLDRGGRELTVQADGRLLMMRGLLGNEGYTTVVRHLSDGRLDPSFQRTRFPGLITALRVQADGRILAAGLSGDPNRPQGEVIRIGHDGRRDESFAMEPFRIGAWTDFFDGLALQPGGKILVLATAYADERRGQPAVARLRARTHCIADAFDPGRYLGFSDEGWFAAAAGRGRDGRPFGALGRGRTNSLPFAQLRLFEARDGEGASAQAAVFGVEPGRGWGLGRVRASAPDAAQFAILDPRLDDSACGGA